MRAAEMSRLLALPLLIGLVAACAGESVTRDAEPPAPPAPAEKQTYADPPPAVAGKITELVSAWVAEQAGEDGVYDIPPRGGKDVAGTLGDFHTVHQKDADTYTVCVDFMDGETSYDVDFFVDRTAEGLVVRDVYLHKIDGEVVPG